MFLFLNEKILYMYTSILLEISAKIVKKINFTSYFHIRFHFFFKFKIKVACPWNFVKVTFLAQKAQ